MQERVRVVCFQRYGRAMTASPSISPIHLRSECQRVLVRPSYLWYYRYRKSVPASGQRSNTSFSMRRSKMLTQHKQRTFAPLTGGHGTFACLSPHIRPVGGALA